MRYVEAQVKIPVQDGTDVLGNKIASDYIYKTVDLRPSTWSAAEVSMYGTEYTQTTRKALTADLDDVFKQAEEVVIDGEKYDVRDVFRVSRWTILHVKGWRL